MFWLLCILRGFLSGPLCLEFCMPLAPWCQAQVQLPPPATSLSHGGRACSDYWALARLWRWKGTQQGGAKSRSRAAASSMSWLCQWIAHLFRVDKGHLYPRKNGGLGPYGRYVVGWGKNICILRGNRGQGKTPFKEVQLGMFQRSDKQQPVPVALEKHELISYYVHPVRIH